MALPAAEAAEEGEAPVKTKKEMKKKISYFIKNIATVFGLVLVWRGAWYVLDGLDEVLLGGSHVWSAILGIIIGIAVLYLPDKDLKEIGKL